MVKQSQEYQLAMPLLRTTALLLGGRSSASKWSRAAWRTRRVASHSRKLASPEVLASLRSPRGKRRRKRASVSCHPSVGAGSGDGSKHKENNPQSSPGDYPKQGRDDRR